MDIRVGTIVAPPFPEARKPAFKLRVDFGGEIGIKRSTAQITVHYTAERRVGRHVAVVNFPPPPDRPVMWEVLTLDFPDADGAVVLVDQTKPVPPGTLFWLPETAGNELD